MAFFDELGKKISQTSQGVVQKTKDTAEVIKLNGMISDEEKRIKNLYMQIGKVYFELHSDSCEEPLADMVASIKEAKSTIEQYSEQVKRLKGIVRCPNCGGDVQYGSPFCSSCGTKMEVKQPTVINEDPSVIHCSKCGMPINDGCAFCTNCGTKVAQEVVANEVTIESTEEAIESNENKCPNCGNNIGDNVFCTNCGTKIEKENPDVVVANAVVEQTSKLCPNCNNQVELDAVFCVNCGIKLEN